MLTLFCGAIIYFNFSIIATLCLRWFKMNTHFSIFLSHLVHSCFFISILKNIYFVSRFTEICRHIMSFVYRAVRVVKAFVPTMGGLRFSNRHYFSFAKALQSFVIPLLLIDWFWYYISCLLSLWFDSIKSSTFFDLIALAIQLEF